MSPDQEAVYEFVTEIRLHQGVSDPVYAKIMDRFGEQGVIDIAGLCGYYTTLAMLMNVARTPVPPGVPLPLAPFPY
jgi:4-carboxymuconolactone decarboxylase